MIPVPLKQEDPDAVLDLQQLLHETFDAAGYADDIYQGRPRPPLHPDDEAWAMLCLYFTRPSLRQSNSRRV